MAPVLKPLIDELALLAKALAESGPSDKSLRELHGWNFADVDRTNMSAMVKILSAKIANISPKHLNSKFDPSEMITRLAWYRTNMIVYLWNGNGNVAFPALSELLNWIDETFHPVYNRMPDWEDALKEQLLPKELAQKIRSLDKRIEAVIGTTDDLEAKVTYIEDAHQAAMALPIDLDSLKEAGAAIEVFKRDAEKYGSRIEIAHQTAASALTAIEKLEAEATKLVESTEDAYSAATTKGLGQAFKERGDALAWSMWVWVVGLMIALFVGAWLGHDRVTTLETMMAKDASMGIIWLNTVLALLSIAAPIWFAWIATKQIGQRFRLAEDYAFKASVARAYEGYRREAARLDPAFAARLFGSALSRIEEAPSRFVEVETYGSPWHEALKMRLQRKGVEAAVKEEKATAEALDEDEANTPMPS